MNNETFRLIARFKVAAARTGLTIDVVRFVADSGYARAMLGRFSDDADEEGVVLALRLLEGMDLASKPLKSVVVPLSDAQSQAGRAKVREAPIPREERKYVGSLRG